MWPLSYTVTIFLQRKPWIVTLGKLVPSFRRVIIVLINKPKVCCICDACLFASKAQTKQWADTLIRGRPCCQQVFPNNSCKRANEVFACSVDIDQSTTLKKRDYTLHMSQRLERDLLPTPHTNIFQNAGGFLFGSMVNVCKWLPEEIQAFRAGERALVQDMPVLEEGDSSCHSTQIIIMHVLGHRERTMPMGKHDSVV